MNITKSHPKYKYARVLKEESEKKYYILGLLAADGWISKKSNRCELALKENDLNFLEYIKNLIVPEKKLKYKQKQKAYRLTIDSAEFVENVFKYFDCENKTKYLCFPSNIPCNFVKHFIRGYIDGDGSIDLFRKYKSINKIPTVVGGSVRLRILGTENFLIGLNQTFISNNIINFRCKPQKKKNENVFYLSWVGSSAEKILDWLYKDSFLYLPRKRAVYNKIKYSDSQTLFKDIKNNVTDYNTRISLDFKDKDIVETFILTNKE